MSYIEAKILTYSGLSSDVKPTNGADPEAGVLNASRFREVDTGRFYIYNLSNDSWYLDYDPTNGVPPSFNKVTASGDTFPLQKGQLNKLRLRQQIINEHAESSRNVIGTVTSTNIVGQIFKASQDNINGLNLTFESAESVLFDDFESYADSAALQAIWVAGTSLATLETAIVAPGGSTKSMAMPTDTLGDAWTKTILATDFTGYNGVFDFYQDKEFNKLKVSVVIGDGTNSKSIQLVVSDKNLWTHFDIPEEALTEDQVAITDMTAIKKVSFRIDDKEPGKTAYVDNYFATPPPGDVGLKLWDMGTDIPVSTTTSIDSGTQYTKIGDAGISGLQESEYILSLIGGKQMYHINGFVAGVALEIPANELLIVNHYYMITVNYVDTEVDVFGPNPEWDNYYINGYSFTAPDEATAITATGPNEDLMFIIFSTQDVYLSQFLQFADSQPNGASSTTLYIEDENMKRSDVIISAVKGQQTVIQEIPKPYFFIKGGKFEQEYNDDFTDDVTTISLNFQYFFEPNTPNG